MEKTIAIKRNTIAACSCKSHKKMIEPLLSRQIKRDILSMKELEKIADALEVVYIGIPEFPDDTKI